jgi:hypothetical protein
MYGAPPPRDSAADAPDNGGPFPIYGSPPPS